MSGPFDLNQAASEASSSWECDQSSDGASSKPFPMDRPYRRCTGEIAWASCARRLREAREKEKQLKSLSQNYLETDIDSHKQRPPVGLPVDGSVRARSLLDLGETLTATASQYLGEDENLKNDGELVAITCGEELLRCRARSMDFLLDEQNRERALPPENQLAASQGRVKSEHELRVERSLQNLTVPEWYKQSTWSSKPKEGFILRRGSDGAASENCSRRRWKGFSSSRTPSASSLVSNSYFQRNLVPKRMPPTSSTDWRYVSSLVSSRESLPPASPASLSPRDCGTFQYSSLSRWSSARLSTGSAPISACTSNRSSRQPYLGWRAAAAASQTPTNADSSPGISPSATSPVYGSRPSSPRRSSQDQQAQITSSTMLRPDSSDISDVSRISPLALYDNANGVFFNAEFLVTQFDDNSIENVACKVNRAYDDKYRMAGPWPVFRRDRYSYTQSLYNPEVFISPGLEDDGPNALFVTKQNQDIPNSNEEQRKMKLFKSPQLPSRVWMESSFVGTKANEKNNTNEKSNNQTNPTIAYPKSASTTASLRNACAPTKQMDTKELIEHLHSFLRNLQDRPMPAISAFTYRPEENLNGPHTTRGKDNGPTLVTYDSEPKVYPRPNHSSTSQNPSPTSSTDNEFWTSICDDMIGRDHTMELADPVDSSHSVSPSSPLPVVFHGSFYIKGEGSDECSAEPPNYSSSRRSSKESCDITQQHRHQQQFVTSRQSSRSESEGRRGTCSGSSSGGTGRRDSHTTLDSSSATTGREKDSKSASLEEVLDSLLAIPLSSRSSSPTSPRHSRSPAWQQRASAPSALRYSTTPPLQPENDISKCQDEDHDRDERRLVKIFSESMSQHLEARNNEEANPQYQEDIDSEVNPGSFCHSPSLEGSRNQSSRSLEVIEPAGGENPDILQLDGPDGSKETVEDNKSPAIVGDRKSGRKKSNNCSSTNSSHLKCHRPKCTKSLPIEEARAKFRTCANCYTFYCSRQCRKLHVNRHKSLCSHTRISNLCKQVLMKARDDHMSRRHLSLCAKRGLLSRGRGAVKLLFLCPEDALDYLVHGWEHSKGQTLYVSRSDLLPQEMGTDVFSQVRSFCDKYNPERKFILLAAVTVTNEASKDSYKDIEVIIRGAKMHLSPSLPEDDVQTLILTLTKEPQTTQMPETTTDDRQKGMASVIEQLDTRGVDIQKFFPDVYQKMLNFVEKSESFMPVSIFPTDKRNGRVFMCIILPWADADIIGNISAKTGTAKSKKRWIR